VFDEILNLRKTLIANAAGDVVGFGGHTEVGSLRRFFEGHRAPALWDPLDLFREFEIDVPIEEDVDFVVEFAGADVFVAEIGVGNLALVERIANPADGVGVGPGNPKAEARSFGGMMRDVGSGSGGGEVETELI